VSAFDLVNNFPVVDGFVAGWRALCRSQEFIDSGSRIDTREFFQQIGLAAHGWPLTAPGTPPLFRHVPQLATDCLAHVEIQHPLDVIEH
jgi:hypothetical protein